jgi:superfamily I DNA and RNA helicase
MAHLSPSLPAHGANHANHANHAFGPGGYAELSLLQTLERGLSEAYTLFHSVDWSRGQGKHEQHGEIDIVVVNQAGDVLLIEVKSGGVDFSNGGIFKSYSGQSKSVTGQVGLQYNALMSRLKDASLSVHLNHLLVLTDVLVQSDTVQWPREQIVDSSEIDHIVSRISQALGPGLSNAYTHERVIAFFENKFNVVADVSALTGRILEDATRLASGLATWVPRMDVPSGTIRIVGTAGSGKTQLALRLLKEANSSGKKAAYLCFNRALADHMARVAPVRTPAETFHEYAVRFLRKSGHAVDFTAQNAFDAIASQCMALLESSEPDLDVMVLDEVQDMQADWVEALNLRLKPEGKLYLLEDPEQQLYRDRVGFELPDAVTVTSHENYRSPKALVSLINGLQLTRVEVESKSNYQGQIPDPIVFETPERVKPCTILAVERCLKLGFAIEDIAVISMRGRERSQLQGLDTLGSWSVRRFTGAFDEAGTPQWTTGQLLIESVRRFKGQAAAAVVLTECDFAELDEINRKLLFVGLTRARLHLEWVISAQADGVLIQHFKNS